MLEEEGSTPTAQGRMGLKLLWPPANLQETSFPPSAKAGLPQRHRKVSGCSEGTPRGHGDGDVLGLLVQGECPLCGAAGAWFGPPGQNLGLWGSNPAEGALVGKPRGLSCHTPHLGFWHPAFLQLLMETPGGVRGELLPWDHQWDLCARSLLGSLSLSEGSLGCSCLPSTAAGPQGVAAQLG